MAIMKHSLSIRGFLLLACAAAGAQVASHAPTVFTKAPAALAPAQGSGPGSAVGTTTVKLAPTGKPIVRVNGAVLTDTDLVREEYAIFPYARQHNGLPKELEPQIRDGALKMIVFEELVYQEALRRKMTVPAAKMQRAEADFRAQFATPEEFNALLQSEFHGSRQLLLQKIRRSLLIDAFLQSEVEDKSAVSPAEVRAYYDNNTVRFDHPESFTFQTISILPPANATAAQLNEGRVRADQALRQAKATKTAEDFGLLAEKISDDDYRVMMGQHKPIPAGQLAPQVVKALLAMKPGDVSDVIQIDQAYTIMRLGEHALAGETKFEDVKAQLEKELPQSKKNQLRAALDKKLRQNAKIEEL
jgi:parvulin-like peptidyl-prolyl isomerase